MTDSPAQLNHCQRITEASETSAAEPSPLSPVPPQPHASSEAKILHPAPLASSHDHSGQAESLAIVPLERIGSLFVVTILVNDTRSARLILDTGASHTILSRGIARDLGLWGQRPTASVTMQTAGGAVQADLMQIDSIRLGGADVRQSIAAIHDLPDAPPDIEGLLGLSVLRQFEVTLDAARNRLLIGPARP